MKKILPFKSIKTLYRRDRNLKEILSPSLFPAKPKNSESCTTSCMKCDICKNYLITDDRFKCKVTGRFYNVKGNSCCNSSNVIYFISFKNCEDPEFIKVTSNLRRIGVALPSILIINALMSKMLTGFINFN